MRELTLGEVAVLGFTLELVLFGLLASLQRGHFERVMDALVLRLLRAADQHGPKGALPGEISVKPDRSTPGRG